MRVVVTGAPRTKKNSQQLVQNNGVRFVIPSAAWKSWLKQAVVLVNGQELGRKLPHALVTSNVNCKARFFRDALRGDACGYYQGIADLLQKRQVLFDDKQIVSWDGSRLDIDRDNPRTEIELETDLALFP